MNAIAPQETKLTVLAVGGTGESYDGDRRSRVSGLLAGVVACLDDRFESRWVVYPASYGPVPQSGGVSYRRSVEIGEANLVAALDDCDGPVMLIGYSQGAVVIRHALHAMARRGGGGLRRIWGVGFIADPHQPPGVVPGCDGWGVAGPGVSLPVGLDVHWVGTPEDMICNAGPDSLLRDVADLTSEMGFRRPVEWLRQLWGLLRDNAFQNASRTAIRFSQVRRDIVRMRSGAREVQGYLPDTLRWGGLVISNRRGGRHTSYAAETYRRHSVTDPDSTGCATLAGWLQVCATFRAADIPAGPVDRDRAVSEAA